MFVYWPEINPNAERSDKDESDPTTFLRSHPGSVTLLGNTETEFEAGRCTWGELGISRLEHCPCESQFVSKGKIVAAHCVLWTEHRLFDRRCGTDVVVVISKSTFASI